MRLENEFSIVAEPRVVWSTMLDIERVAGCFPGAQLVGVSDEGGYDANVKVKVGPIVMTYRGTLKILDRDEAALTASMQARARETRGQGTAHARMMMNVSGDAEALVRIETDLEVTGRVAQMGRRVMQDVASRLMDEFSRNLEAQLADSREHEAAAAAPPSGFAPPFAPEVGKPQESEPIGGLRLAVDVARSWFGRLIRKLSRR